MIARGSIDNLVTNYVIEYTLFTTFIGQSYYNSGRGYIEMNVNKHENWQV